LSAHDEPQGGERMLRDMERWKDRVEVSLDNRQVFFLFFGCAVVACLVFMLGVLVGKRLEARARDQALPVRSDPLAALDPGPDEDEPQATERRAALAPSAAAPVKRASAAPSAKAVASPEPEAKKPAPPEPEAKKPASDKIAVPADKLAAASRDQKSHYALQLSAFQDRAEADEFAKKISGSGFKPSIVAADIPGRGVWYRVRVGDFATQRAALEAKAEFERKLHLIAYVTRF
jgi:cell division septation protein DedD